MPRKKDSRIVWEHAISRIIGTADEFPLEHRFFNSACFLGGGIGILASFINIFLALGAVLVIVSFTYSLILLGMYYLSRFRGQNRFLIWPLVLISCIALSAAWFLNAGSNGSTIFVYLNALIVFVIMTRGKGKFLISLLVIGNILLLFFIEFLHPDWVIPYAKPQDRYFDILFTVVFCIFVILFAILSIVKSYYDEKAKVEEEKAIIAKRNQVMESELDMARHIQSRLIPSECPLASLACVYRPMDKVGGDFYDFLRLPEPGKTGILLSDVSGHGVPAAFITSFLKSALNLNAGLYGDPALLLTALNDTLCGLESERFVTAFYGVYDTENGVLTYANAGHSSPWSILEGKAVSLPDMYAGVPLGLFNREQLAQNGLILKNHRLELPKGGKLFLFTDGLTEALPLSVKKTNLEDKSFEFTKLPEVIRKSFHLPAAGFLDAVIKELVIFRGAEDFDDDICLICLDVQ